MTIEIFKEQILFFLNSDKTEVLAIRGKWGVGKTFLWKKLFKEALEKGEVKRKKYSYVSLFGINSLIELKQAIITEQSGTERPLEQNLFDTYISPLKSHYKKISDVISAIKMPYINANNMAPLLEAILYHSIDNSIICLDDIERTGKNLSLQDILGVISSLREQKNCKVVVIFNEEYLDDDNKSTYQTFREKCIDKDLLYCPTAEEIVTMVLLNNSSTYEKIKRYCIDLNITNIRIIQKIESLAIELENLLDKYDHSILNHTLHSLVLFSWCFYGKSNRDDSVPNLEYILNNGGG